MTNPKDIVAQARKAARDKRSKKEPESDGDDDEDRFSIEISITVKKNGQKLTKKAVNNAISDWCGNMLSAKS